FLLAAAAALGCGGLAALYACGSGPTRGAGPSIVTDPPAEVVFAGVVSGDTATRPVTVRNLGSSDLLISGISLNGTDGGFALGDDVDAVKGVSIAPGDERKFTVAYTPRTTGDHSGALEIASNDFVTPRLALNLRSSQKGPRIACTPAFVDFALVENRSGPVTATCRNDGTDPFPVESFFLDGSAEFGAPVVTGLSPGDTLGVGQSFTVQVSYTMSLAGNGRGFFVVKPPTAAGVSRGQLPLFGPPVAAAGADITVAPLTLVNLDGSRSRAPGNTAGVSVYTWALTRAPTGSKTADQFTNGEEQWVKEISAGVHEVKCTAGQNKVMAPCFFPDVPGVYTFALKIRDHRADCPLGRGGCQDPAQCCSFACAAGTCAQTGGVCSAAGSGCDIDSANGVDAAQPDLDHEIGVHAIPAAGIYVQLKWDNNGDFDLHLARESADPASGRKWNDRSGGSCTSDSQCSSGKCNIATSSCAGTGNDCYYNNPNPDWGVLDPTNNQSCLISADCTHLPFSTCRGAGGNNKCIDASDDPRLLIDMTTAGGPEAIEMKLPPIDAYHIGVDHFPNQSDATKGNATIRVFVGGVEIYADGVAGPVTQGLGVSDFWYAGYLVVPAILSDAHFVAANVQTGAVQPCSSGANPCHRTSAADYPVIPPLP
ncbi:MAG TPA: choice-of-anchor D domain-containing protein, partial [Polyangia bacterium]